MITLPESIISRDLKKIFGGLWASFFLAVLVYLLKVAAVAVLSGATAYLISSLERTTLVIVGSSLGALLAAQIIEIK